MSSKVGERLMESKIEDRWPRIGSSSKDTVIVLKQVHMGITFRVKKMFRYLSPHYCEK